MNPSVMIGEQLFAMFESLDTLLSVIVVLVSLLLMAAGYACFLAIERFKQWNNRDKDQRAREAMLLRAERVRFERAFKVSQSVRRG